jgi:hypothetical protein
MDHRKRSESMNKDRSNERGSSRLKFVITVAILGCLAYVGYLYIPIAYRAYLFKDLMQHYADVAGAQGYQPAWAAEQLFKSEAEYEVPNSAIITPALREQRIEVRVQFTKPIEFPGYTYTYEFDHTVKSTAFLSFK